MPNLRVRFERGPVRPGFPGSLETTQTMEEKMNNKPP